MEKEIYSALVLVYIHGWRRRSRSRKGRMSRKSFARKQNIKRIKWQVTRLENEKEEEEEERGKGNIRKRNTKKEASM